MITNTISPSASRTRALSPLAPSGAACISNAAVSGTPGVAGASNAAPAWLTATATRPSVEATVFAAVRVTDVYVGTGGMNDSTQAHNTKQDRPPRGVPS